MISDQTGKDLGQEHKTKEEKPNSDFLILSHAFNTGGPKSGCAKEQKTARLSFPGTHPLWICSVLPTLAPPLCCRKGDPSQGPRVGSCLTLGNELSKETHMLTKQETFFLNLFFLINLFYLFIFGCVGSSFLCEGFL